MGQQIADGVLRTTLHTLNKEHVKEPFFSSLKKMGTKIFQHLKSDKCLVPTRQAVNLVV